jgi:DNA repair exonuclease SbcCD ATPase subunit
MVKIHDDLDIDITMSDGFTRGANRLSGGQKVMLSVVMHFAINDLFSNQIGLIVLDEPTQQLDADNIKFMGELFKQISEISRKSGVQTIVITHAHEMVPDFDNVIDLT